MYKGAAEKHSDLQYWEDEFLAACKKFDVEPRYRVALFPEALEFWDELGNLQVAKLKKTGIPAREWWS